MGYEVLFKYAVNIAIKRIIGEIIGLRGVSKEPELAMELVGLNRELPVRDTGP